MKWAETRVPGPRELSGLSMHSAEGERAALEPEVASQGADPTGGWQWWAELGGLCSVPLVAC